MNTVSKAFQCSDLERQQEWPKSLLLRDYLKELVSSRRVYRGIRLIESNIKPDKKSRQWWSKFCVEQSFFNFHMYSHHLMRQVIDKYRNEGLKYKAYDEDIELVNKFIEITEQCVWRPNE